MNMADHTTLSDDFLFGSSVASCHQSIRLQFLRKVYGIVAAQLSVVTVMSIFIMSFEPVKLFFQNNPGFLLLAFLGTMVSLLAVHVKRMDYPTNFILLGLFTLFESFTIGTLVSFFDKFLVVQALIITSVIVCCLTMYTFQTKRDFSTMGAGLFAFLSVLFAGVLLQIFLQSPVMDIVLAMAGALLFSGFLIYDTQQIMRKCSPEEYIVGAITIYLDITRLFIEILRILEALRQK